LKDSIKGNDDIRDSMKGDGDNKDNIKGNDDVKNSRKGDGNDTRDSIKGDNDIEDSIKGDGEVNALVNGTKLSTEDKVVDFDSGISTYVLQCLGHLSLRCSIISVAFYCVVVFLYLCFIGCSLRFTRRG
jgi:hypothetical protein